MRQFVFIFFYFVALHKKKDTVIKLFNLSISFCKIMLFIGNRYMVFSIYLLKFFNGVSKVFDCWLKMDNIWF